MDKHKIAYEEEQEKILSLWYEYLSNDKRSFNEYFSEEFGFTCDEGITYKQLRFLCVMFFHNQNVKGNLWEKKNEKRNY